MFALRLFGNLCSTEKKNDKLVEEKTNKCECIVSVYKKCLFDKLNVVFLLGFIIFLRKIQLINCKNSAHNTRRVFLLRKT